MADEDSFVPALDVDQEEYFGELVGFLADPKVAVQRLAAEGLVEQTESIDFIEYCKRKPRKVGRELLRLAERAEAGLAKPEKDGRDGEGEAKKGERARTIDAMETAAAGAAALKCLVNLSAVPSVCAELVDMNAARRCCESLKGGWLEGRSDLAHWYAMLLANLSTGEAGQKALCAEEGHLRFLLSAYVAKSRPPARDGYDDPMCFLGKVINNVCALEEGRKILARDESSASTMGMLSAQLADRGRRPDVTSAFRNLCLDKECHESIVTTDLLTRLARFVYPWDKSAPERRATLPECMQEVLQADGATVTGDVSVRHAAAQSILGLCLTESGRTYLRAGGCYEVVRAWHVEEDDHDTRAALETTVTYIQQTEEELAAAEAKIDRSGLPTPEPKGLGYEAAEQPPAAPAAEDEKAES